MIKLKRPLFLISMLSTSLFASDPANRESDSNATVVISGQTFQSDQDPVERDQASSLSNAEDSSIPFRSEESSSSETRVFQASQDSNGEPSSTLSDTVDNTTPAAISSEPAQKANSPIEQGLQKLESLSKAKTPPFAQQPSSSSASPPYTEAPTHQRPMDRAMHIEAGGNYTRVHMTPNNNPSFSGNLGGAQSIFEWKAMDQGYLGVKFAWRQGTMHGSAGSRTLLDLDVEDRAGYTFGSRRDHWTITPFTGFGFRYLKEHIGQLTFEYNEFYVPLGFLSNYRFNSLFAGGLDLTWMPQVYPTVLIDPLKGARWVTTHKLSNFLVEVPCTFTVSCKHHLALIIKPFFEYWQDGHTTAETETGVVLGIPENTYLFGGIDVNLCYSF